MKTGRLWHVQWPKWDKALARASDTEETTTDIQVQAGDGPFGKSRRREDALPHSRTTQETFGDLDQLQGRGKALGL